MNTVWQSHKSLGFSYKTFRYPFSQRLKCQRAKNKGGWGFTPGRVRSPILMAMPQHAEGTPDASPMEASSCIPGSLSQQQETSTQPQDLRLQRALPLFSPSSSLALPTYLNSEEREDDAGTVSSKSSFVGSGSSSTRTSSSLHSSAESSEASAETMLPAKKQHPKLVAGPAVQKRKSSSQGMGSCLATFIFALGSSIGTDESFFFFRK